MRALWADADRVPSSPSPNPATAPVTAPAAAPGAAPAIRLDAVTKVFGRGDEAVVALDRLDLTVDVGSFVCLVGASGCGKSTLLNIVAGLDAPTTGRVEVAGGRPTLIFQEAALFPWLTAAENVELALRLRRVPRRQRRERVEELLELVHLSGFAAKRPHELSGGMRQRVALARALAQEARILLLDEPFGALDAITRDLLHEELERIWRDTGLTILFVTHNVREAVRLGQRVVLLSSRPGRAVAEFPVVIAGERRIESPDVSALAITIGQQLSEQVRRHATR
jgi:NitT/TauT family transport system ATP-binding protein